MNEFTPPRDITRDAKPEPEPREGTWQRKDGASTETGPEARKPEDRDILLLWPGEGGESDETTRPETSNPPPKMPSYWVFVGVAVVLLALLAWGIYGYWQKHEAATATRQQSTGRVVNVRVETAEAQKGPVEVTLPGETQAFDVANIYARATGYVTDRRVDIGSRVKKGDLLLHIAAPDLDQQLAQAKAQLGQVQAALLQAQSQVTQANANLGLANVNLGRANALVGQGYETLQNRDTQQTNQSSQQAGLDTAKGGVKVAEANVKAQQATIDRLEALTAFEDVVAPFDGVVTARSVDLGALINADTATGAPLFTIARDDVLRVLVQVPQPDAVGVKDGLDAKVLVPQYPDRVFAGKVTRNSGALVSSARTLTTEVDIPNRDGVLRSGLFAYVSIGVPRTRPEVVVPAETLIFNQEGLQVAIVGQDNKIKLQPVTIYRDHGTSVDLSDGLSGGERVVLSPPADIENGSAVKIETDDPQSKGQDQPPGGKS